MIGRFLNLVPVIMLKTGQIYQHALINLSPCLIKYPNAVGNPERHFYTLDSY